MFQPGRVDRLPGAVVADMTGDLHHVSHVHAGLGQHERQVAEAIGGLPGDILRHDARFAIPAHDAAGGEDRPDPAGERDRLGMRSEENTSELQSLMRISYAVLCLKKKIQYISY